MQDKNTKLLNHKLIYKIRSAGHSYQPSELSFWKWENALTLNCNRMNLQFHIFYVFKTRSDIIEDTRFILRVIASSLIAFVWLLVDFKSSLQENREIRLNYYTDINWNTISDISNIHIPIISHNFSSAQVTARLGCPQPHLLRSDR